MYRPRIYAHGPPNNDKTGAIVRTAQRPILFINSPGETGYDTIPDNDPDVSIYPLFDPTQASDKLLQQVEKACSDAIKGGLYQKGTIVFEGIHNLMDYVMDMLTGGEYFHGAKPDWSTFGLCYHWMDLFISRLMVNNVHQVIITGWSKEKSERKLRKGEKPEDIPQSVGPSMLGEYSRTIIGRVPMVLHQTLRPVPDTVDKEGKKVYASAWQTRPYGMVKGCGMKGPEKIVRNMPLYIPADYEYLKQIWEELEKS